jgi:uncharacterized protein YjbI with pentapeptide repeats
MSMSFLRKSTLMQGSDYVQIDMATGVLSVASQPGDGSDKFNLYGTDSGFILQAMNGKYVVTDGTGYAATAERTASGLNQFSQEAASGPDVRIVDLGSDGGGSTQYYWNNDGGALKSIAKSATPPATTEFSDTTVTVGLAKILSQGFGVSQPDLTWVDLSGTDFTAATTSLDFTQVNMTHADLSSTRFDQGTGFTNSTGKSVDFSNAHLNGCSMGGIDFSGAKFVNAKLEQIQFDSSTFANADLTDADLSQSINLANANFDTATLVNANFSNSANIVETSFRNADLSGAVFTGSSVTGTMDISGANLTGAALNNTADRVTIYPKMIVFSATTNFTQCNISHIDFTGYDFTSVIATQADLTGCTLDKATFLNTELAYATLDDCSITGTVQLNGANLSNASLMGANLTSAQLGALAQLFGVAQSSADYTAFLKALQTGDTSEVGTIFSKNGYPLTGSITITPSRFTDTSWTVSASGTTYTVSQDQVGGQSVIDVYQPTVPAVLSNAFMVNVTLTGANMIGVNASGASIYGNGGHNPNLNSVLLQGASFSNANLSNADFSSADLAGVNFDYATLTNAVFQNTSLITAAGGGRASFVGANLQGANFDGATLTNVAFTNAALGVADPLDTSRSAGVWLFSLSQAEKALVESELTSAAAHQFEMDMQALQQLQDPGPVGSGIVVQFSNHAITLTSDAVLTIIDESIYWQLTDGSTQYVIFDSYDSKAFQPALGVATGTEYTPDPEFTLPLSLEKDLKNGPVDERLVAAFKAAGHPITSAATLAAAQHPTEWQIINGAPDYTVYTIWLDLSAGETRLTVRPTISTVISTFAEFSYAIDRRATVSTISSGGWQLSNDSENPFNPVKNYIIFKLLPNSDTGDLDVYGSFIRIERLSAPGVSEFYNIPAAITSLSQSQMEGSGNVCPNGDFASTNKSNGLSYDEWLRARVNPRPPFCVPDPAGMYVCPR